MVVQKKMKQLSKNKKKKKNRTKVEVASFRSSLGKDLQRLFCGSKLCKNMPQKAGWVPKEPSIVL